eukprot:TRINITY_DN4096_c0_g1_i1.p1 TRINITY_DN4096_c0_g1~~TRINITY_DN4096_c0_g1_i1.p1  ORF type:complete len:452 (-),score=68.03 TRINITY_DN4096_c0_g1_i1:78-1433(-)
MTSLSFLHDQANDWVSILQSRGHAQYRAIQAITVTKGVSLSEAESYLEHYKQPIGVDRSPASRIGSRGRHAYTHELQDLLETIDCFSAPGTTYDFDLKIDPAQIYDWSSKRTLFELGQEIGAGLSYTQKLCAAYDWIKNRITYARDVEWRGVGNYWPSAAETIVTKKGDCADQAIVFCALAESMGYLSRFLCVPGHSFCSVLIDPAQFSNQEVQEWIDMHPSTEHGGYRSGASGISTWRANGRCWIMADLTMCNYLGAMNSENVKFSDQNTWNYPADWIKEVGGSSVTYRYASDQGCRFEWLSSSTVDGPWDETKGTVWHAGDVDSKSANDDAKNNADTYLNLVWNVTTISGSGKRTTYMLSLGVSLDGACEVTGTCWVGDPQKQVRVAGSYVDGVLAWREFHVEAGTYANDYEYSIALDQTQLQGVSGAGGTYSSLNLNYSGSFEWESMV